MKLDDVFTLQFHKALTGRPCTGLGFHYLISFQQMLKAYMTVKISLQYCSSPVRQGNLISGFEFLKYSIQNIMYLFGCRCNPMDARKS
jgi:hypothetical protein